MGGGPGKGIIITKFEPYTNGFVVFCRFLLLSNELKVLLISDAATEKAAAALAVRVGELCLVS